MAIEFEAYNKCIAFQIKARSCKNFGAPFSFMEGNTSLKFFFFCGGRPSTND